MDYKEQYDKAKEANKAKGLVTQICTFDEEGQQLIGRVAEVIPFTGGDFDAEVNQYTFVTDNGVMTAVLGSATDKQLDKKDIVGKLVCVTFHGKKTLKDGKQVNIFEVEEF